MCVSEAPYLAKFSGQFQYLFIHRWWQSCSTEASQRTQEWLHKCKLCWCELLVVTTKQHITAHHISTGICYTHKVRSNSRYVPVYYFMSKSLAIMYETMMYWSPQVPCPRLWWISGGWCGRRGLHPLWWSLTWRREASPSASSTGLTQGLRTMAPFKSPSLNNKYWQTTPFVSWLWRYVKPKRVLRANNTYSYVSQGTLKWFSNASL